MDYVNWIVENWTGIFSVITGAVTFASIIVKLTPSTTDDTVLAKIVSVLDVIAINTKK